ncbi:MAG: ABC transporter ATP-binding protein [Pseudomonadota bacterium]
MTDLLVVDSLSKRFRGLQAVKNVSFAVPENRIVALIGPNGAGKTTTFNLIAGALPPDTGHVRLAERNLLGLRPDQVCAAGIARTFQLVKPFAELSVEDNVMVGALHRRHRTADARMHARAVIELVELGPLRHRRAASLTLPDRKRLELAKALATEPRILLLDEVMAGLRPTETDRMVGVLRALNRDTGMAILLIEHVMRAVMALSDHVIVLDQGEKISEGAPAAVVGDPRVVACYLGPEAVA